MKGGHMLVVVAVIALVVGGAAGYYVGITTSTPRPLSIMDVGNQTFITYYTTLSAYTGFPNEGATFVYPLAVYYAGPWTVHYWVEDFTGTLNAISGNLLGPGNSETWITFYISGAGEYTMCASATSLPPKDSQQKNLPTLTLSLLAQNESTTTSNPTVEVCGTMAV